MLQLLFKSTTHKHINHIFHLELFSPPLTALEKCLERQAVVQLLSSELSHFSFFFKVVFGGYSRHGLFIELRLPTELKQDLKWLKIDVQETSSQPGKTYKTLFNILPSIKWISKNMNYKQGNCTR